MGLAERDYMRRAGGVRLRRRSAAAAAAIVVLVLALVLVDGHTRSWARDRVDNSRVSLTSKPLIVGRELRVGPSRSLDLRHDPWKQFLATDAACPRGGGAAAEERQAVCLLNYARRRAGLPELRESPLLARAARLKALDIVRCHQFAHTACGRDAHAVADDVGYPHVAWGENIYLGSGPYAPPRLAVDGWLNSRGHRENLFRREWTEQGIAVLHVKFGTEHNVAIWVSQFGAARQPNA